MHLRTAAASSPLPATDSADALGAVLALMVVSDAHIHPAEIDTLESLDAFRRIGMPRSRFMALLRDFQGDSRRGRADALLSTVQDPELRLLVARLAAAVVTADGRVDSLERMVYDHLLMRWGLSQQRVAQAIREDRIPA
jgi:tellurite resistance protein